MVSPAAAVEADGVTYSFTSGQLKGLALTTSTDSDRRRRHDNDARNLQLDC